MTQKPLVMKDDIMFKAFFSKIGNEKFLKDFLCAILGKDLKIKRVLHDIRLEQLAREQKYGILDLDVELENGEIINIEMQIRNHRNIEERTTFYASKKISEQLGPNEKYENLKKVIIIAILDYSFIDLPEFIHKTVRVINNHKNYELNNLVTYYYIELEKFRKQSPDMNEPLNQWLSFIDMERSDLLEMAKKKNKLIEEAVENYNVLTGNDEVKRLAEIRLMSALEEQSALATARYDGALEGRRLGLEEGKRAGIEEGKKAGIEEGKKAGIEEGKKAGIEEGKKAGIEEGMQKKQLEIAKKLLSQKMTIEEIIFITGLKKEELINIK